MRTSDQINELAAALAAAQASMKTALKDSDNPAFNSKYADLASVWSVAREPLTTNGLAVIQLPVHSEDDHLHLTTRLVHKSGQWVEETMSIPVAKANAHGYGSGITYCRRFALSALVGIVADADDDGNAAAEQKRMSAKSFTDFCTAMSDATTDEDLRKAYSNAIRAARACGDTQAEASFVQKKQQLKDALQVVLRG